MTEKHQLIAYLFTLAASVTSGGLGAIHPYNGKSNEAVSVVAAITGLIGLIEVPFGRNPAATVEQAGTVVSTSRSIDRSYRPYPCRDRA